MVGILFFGATEPELWSFCQTDAPLNNDIVNYYNPIYLLFIKTIEFITDSIPSLLCESNIENLGHPIEMKAVHGRTVQLLIDFILIIVIYLFASHPKEMILFSDSSLGRLIAVILILFYASISPVYGFFVCALIVLYYQTDMVEHLLNQKNDIRFEEGLMNLTYELWNGPAVPSEPWAQAKPESSFSFYQSGDAGIYKYVPYQSKSEENEDKFDRSIPSYLPKYNPKVAENPPLGKTDEGLFPWRR